jgi:WXXGXW repeat (2 copies)
MWKVTVLAGVTALVLAGCAGNRTSALQAPPAPPPPIAETIPPQPAPGYVWVPGVYTWNANTRSYVWVPGHWAIPPRGYVWVPGHWQTTSTGHVWVDGQWRAQQ